MENLLNRRVNLLEQADGLLKSQFVSEEYMGEPEMKVNLKGQRLIDSVIRSPMKPESILLNGQRVAIEFDEDNKLLRLSTTMDKSTKLKY